MSAEWKSRTIGTPLRVSLNIVGLSLALAALMVLIGFSLRTVYATPQACVPGPHNGTITTDEQWCLIDSPHIVNDAISVAVNATVTIEPGVVVQFTTSGSGLLLYGGLVAEGTPEQPITLTAQSVNWAGILAYSGSQFHVSNCDIGYASGDYWHTSVTVNSGADLQMRHCRIHDMTGMGLKLQNDGLTGVFEDLEIDHNSGDGVWQNTLNMNPTYSNLNIHDNGLDAVNIPGYTTLNQDVLLDGSPAALNGAPIYLDGATVSQGTTLTVTPGTVLKMLEGSGGIVLNGSMVVEGTPEQPITLTAQSGHWAGISANSGSQLHLSFCDIGYTAGDYWKTSISIQAGAEVDIRNFLIHNSLGNGLNINAAQVSLQNIAFVDNTSAGLWLVNGSRVNGRHLTLVRNNTGVQIDLSSTIILTNTIVAENTIGINVASGGSTTMVNTLWDSNTTTIMGVVNETGHIDGPAYLDTDGYHILPESEAVQRGIYVGVGDDIDGDTRPAPAGTIPDIGADECPVLRYFYYHIPIVFLEYP